MNDRLDPKSDNNLQNNAELSVFYNNPTLSFIHKKAEKISCAIYWINMPNIFHSISHKYSFNTSNARGNCLLFFYFK